MLRDEIKQIKSTRKDLKKFGLMVGTALIILGVLFVIWNKESAVYLLIAGPLLVLLGLFLPASLKYLQKAWMTLTVILAWIITNVLLSLLFYIGFTIIGMIARLFKKPFLDLSWQDKRQTYWNFRETRKPDRTQLEKQF